MLILGWKGTARFKVHYTKRDHLLPPINVITE